MKGGNDDRISFLGELLKITCKTNNKSSFDTLVCLIIIKLFKIQYMTIFFSNVQFISCMSLFTSVNCEDYVNTLTHNSETPLYFAARNGHLRAVKWLIKGGADINRTTNELSCPLFAGKLKVPRITISDHVNHVYFSSFEPCYTCLIFCS